MKSISQSGFITADTNILPPNGYKRQILFKLNDEIRIPTLEVTNFNYQLDITTSTGEGSITIAYTKDIYEKLKTYDEFEMYWGWSEKGDLKPINPDRYYNVNPKSKTVGKDALELNSQMIDKLPLILTGFIKAVKQVGNTIVIDFYDRGILLEKEDIYESATWSRAALCADIITKAGLSYAFDWAGDPAYDETITFPEPEETDAATDAAAATDPLTAGSTTTLPGMARMPTKIGNATINLWRPTGVQETVATSANLAGIVGGGTTATDTQSSVQNAVEGTGETIPATGTATDAPQQHDAAAIQGGTYSTQVVCMPAVNGSCGRCGYEKGQPTCFANKCMSPTCGKEGALRPSTKYGGKFKNQINCSACDADYCGKCGWVLTGNFEYQLTLATDATGNTTQAEKGKTYWDLLTKAIEPTKNDLMMFVLLNTVYIIKIPSPEQVAVYVDDTLNVTKGSVTITDPLPDAINTVIVSYGKGAKASTVKSSFPEMVKKYGKKEQKFKEPGLTKQAAQNVADTKLRMLNRTDGMKIDLTALGTPFFTPHNWCRTRLTKYDIDEIFYITRFNLQFQAGKIPTAGLSLAEFYPDLTIVNQTDDKTDIMNGEGGAGSGTPAAMQAIVDKEATFLDHQHGNHSKMSTLINTGSGDCWADSYWCYDQLTKAGFKARIACGDGGCVCNGAGHRFTQYWNGKAWVNFPYKKGSQGGVKGRTADAILKKPWDSEGTGC